MAYVLIIVSLATEPFQPARAFWCRVHPSPHLRDDNYHHSSRASCHSGWDDGGAIPQVHPVTQDHAVTKAVV